MLLLSSLPSRHAATCVVIPSAAEVTEVKTPPVTLGSSHLFSGDLPQVNSNPTHRCLLPQHTTCRYMCILATANVSAHVTCYHITLCLFTGIMNFIKRYDQVLSRKLRLPQNHDSPQFHFQRGYFSSAKCKLEFKSHNFGKSGLFFQLQTS